MIAHQAVCVGAHFDDSAPKSVLTFRQLRLMLFLVSPDLVHVVHGATHVRASDAAGLSIRAAVYADS